jgi:hypothetical protein
VAGAPRIHWNDLGCLALYMQIKQGNLFYIKKMTRDRMNEPEDSQISILNHSIRVIIIKLKIPSL